MTADDFLGLCFADCNPQSKKSTQKELQMSLLVDCAATSTWRDTGSERQEVASFLRARVVAFRNGGPSTAALLLQSYWSVHQCLGMQCKCFGDLQLQKIIWKVPFWLRFSLSIAKKACHQKSMLQLAKQKLIVMPPCQLSVKHMQEAE